MPHSIRNVIVSDGLIRTEQGYLLHPALFGWQKPLMKAKWQWFAATSMLPLEWYAEMHGVSPAAIVLPGAETVPQDAVQYFIASPYHAQMARDRIRVMPESMFPWSSEQGRELCDALNPLLVEDGLSLVPAGAHLLLFSRRKLDVSPVSFAELSGKYLPNRHPQGADGGFLMRLMAEIQMLIRGNPMHAPVQRYPLHGLWFWGACELPSDPLPASMRPVATRNPFLRSLCEGRDASTIISEAELIGELLNEKNSPKRWLLAGEDVALLATLRSYPWLSQRRCEPYNVQPEASLAGELAAF